MVRTADIRRGAASVASRTKSTRNESPSALHKMMDPCRLLVSSLLLLSLSLSLLVNHQSIALPPFFRERATNKRVVEPTVVVVVVAVSKGRDLTTVTTANRAPKCSVVSPACHNKTAKPKAATIAATKMMMSNNNNNLRRRQQQQQQQQQKHPLVIIKPKKKNVARNNTSAWKKSWRARGKTIGRRSFKTTTTMTTRMTTTTPITAVCDA